jgi:nucleoid-associated protein YgaU
MFKKNAVRYLAVWVTILVGLGLIDYAHLHKSESHPSSAPAAHAQAAGVPSTTKPDITHTSRPSAPTEAPSRQVATPANTGRRNQAVGTRPAAATPANRERTQAQTVKRAVAAPTNRDRSQASAVAPQPVHQAATASPQTVTQTYVVQAHDTLWELAAVHLGNPLQWTELFALNQGRQEPGGLVFTNPNLIYPGWTLTLPAGGGSSGH